MQYLTPDFIGSYDIEKGDFSNFTKMVEAADGLSLRQVCSLTGLEPSTIQNWIKRGFVPHPVSKKYGTRHLARILLISVLRDCMKIDNIGLLLNMVNGDTDDTSDDIISEEELYDCLCRVIRVSDSSVGISDIPELVRHTTAELDNVKSSELRILNNALEIMISAYISGQYKKAVEEKFKLMKEVYNESKDQH